MKKYAVVTDISPSEQIGEDDDSIFCLGILVGLQSPQSIEKVGDQFPKIEERLQLRKYANSPKKYKRSMIEHLKAILRSGQAIAGMSIVNQRFIKSVGLRTWTKIYGELPSPSGHNNKDKPRYTLGGYIVDGQIKPCFEVLSDDLAILGWMAEEFRSLHKFLCERSGMPVKLSILIDRLPNDQGTDGSNKGEILKSMLIKMSDGVIEVVGTHDISVTHQRDLLVDNIAGLGREVLGGNCASMNIEELYKHDVISFIKTKLPK
jgi:hypothetical protein